MISDEGSAGSDFLWQTQLFSNSSPSFISFISTSPRDEEEGERDEDDGDSTQNQLEEATVTQLRST